MANENQKAEDLEIEVPEDLVGLEGVRGWLRQVLLDHQDRLEDLQRVQFSFYYADDNDFGDGDPDYSNTTCDLFSMMIESFLEDQFGLSASDRAELVKEVLESGVDQNAFKDCSYQSPLNAAVYCDEILIVRELLKYQPDLTVSSEQGGILHLATCDPNTKNMAVLKLLIESGVSDHITDKFHQTAEESAFYVGHTVKANYLKEVRLALEEKEQLSKVLSHPTPSAESEKSSSLKSSKLTSEGPNGDIVDGDPANGSGALLEPLKAKGRPIL